MADKTLLKNIKAAIAADTNKPELGNIDLHTTRELIMDAGAVLLDVRPPAKVSGENAQEAGIRNAYYTPFPRFTDYMEVLPEDKTTPIVTACMKNFFANRVMGYLEAMGYQNVYALAVPVTDLIEVHHAHADK